MCLPASGPELSATFGPKAPGRRRHDQRSLAGGPPNGLSRVARRAAGVGDVSPHAHSYLTPPQKSLLFFSAQRSARQRDAPRRGVLRWALETLY